MRWRRIDPRPLSPCGREGYSEGAAISFDREGALDIDDHIDLEPQVVQLKFPAIEELRAEMMEVNERLIAYRDKMRAIVTSS